MITQDNVNNSFKDVFDPFHTVIKEKTIVPILPHLILISVVVIVISVFKIPIWKNTKKFSSRTSNFVKRRIRRYKK